MPGDNERGRPSYESVNYALRPAKAIERRMLCEVFRRLYPFQPIDQYGYVGLGSIYFTDFQLVHRELGITELISIERESENADRFRLNLPLGCIDLRFSESKEVLPNLDWTKRRIVWLDYDGRLDQDVLADVGTVTTKAAPGSMLVLSVNGQAEGDPPEEQRRHAEAKTGETFSVHTYRLQQLTKRLEGKVPKPLLGKELKGEGLARISRKVILDEVMANLAIRNKFLAPDEKVTFTQVVNFHYKDGALMVTLGLVFYEQRQEPIVAACRFSELEFVRSGDEHYSIRVPCLTAREIHHLNSFLPTSDASAMPRRGIPEEDVRRYSEVYRYFPTFNEVLLT